MGEFAAALGSVAILLGAVIWAEFRHKKQPRQDVRDMLRRER